MLAAMLLVLAVPAVPGVTVTAQAASATLEGKGYKSGKAAVKAYLAALKKSDMDACVKTFAVEHYVKYFDQIAYHEYIDSASGHDEMPFPSEGGALAQSLSKYKRLEQITSEMDFQYMHLTGLDSAFPENSLVLQFTSDTEIADYVAKQKKSQKSLFASLRFVKFEDPAGIADGYYSSEKNQATLQKWAAYLGAKEVRSIVAQVQVNGETWRFCFDTVNYQGKWYVYRLGGDASYLLGYSNWTGGAEKE